jgi:tRNA(Ile)-lysidine synthase
MRPRENSALVLHDNDLPLGRGILAVSGGSDSMALMHLAAALPHAASRFVVVSVDHGLRPESVHECAFVMLAAQALGFEAYTLSWTGEKPLSRVIERAREARYALLLDAARRHGCTFIATGHTLDDQAETVLMRLGHGSGLRGLRGMEASVTLGDVQLVRPLLTIAREDLRQFLRSLSRKWVEDPTNENTAYERPRLRAQRAAREALGLTDIRLAKLARRVLRADQALDDALDALWPELWVDEEPRSRQGGRLRLPVWLKAPCELRIRALERVLRLCGLSGFARLEKIESLEEALSHAACQEKNMRRSLGGVIFDVKRDVLAFSVEGPRKRAFKLKIGLS